jgi:hypothetical protein
MRGENWMSAATAAAWLQKQYEDWTVSTVTGHSGVRIMAVRIGAPPGLCTVIGEFSEVRAQLEAVRRGTLRALHPAGRVTWARAL